MTVPPNTSKTHRFRIWAIILLIAVVSASMVFVAHVASRPSEPFISINLGRTGTTGLIIIETSNRMSFDVSYLIEAETYSERLSFSTASFHHLLRTHNKRSG